MSKCNSNTKRIKDKIKSDINGDKNGNIVKDEKNHNSNYIRKSLTITLFDPNKVKCLKKNQPCSNVNIISTYDDKFNSKDSNICLSHRTRAQKQWSVVLNVIKLLKNMRNIDTKMVQNIDEIDRSLDFHKGNKKHVEDVDRSKLVTQIEGKANFTENLDNFEEFQKQVILFEYVASGVDDRIKDIIKIINSDPRIGKYKKEDYYVNKKNHEGFTALYIACLNGHIKIVEILLEYDANHLVYCGEHEDKDSALDVSIRWSHTKIVELLLNKLEWPPEYLRKAFREACDLKNEVLKNMIKKAMVKNKKSKNSTCFCFSK